MSTFKAVDLSASRIRKVPKVLSVSPNYGSTLGGTEVTIKGKHFLSLDMTKEIVN